MLLLHNICDNILLICVLYDRMHVNASEHFTTYLICLSICESNVTDALQLTFSFTFHFLAIFAIVSVG